MSTSLRVRAVLFDMDGTLVDSTEAVTRMWTDFAREVGADPAEVVASAHGVPTIDTLRRFLSAEESVQEWFARLSQWEHDGFEGVREIPGAVRVVSELPADAWAVVTSALGTAAAARLASVGFPSPRILIGADDVAAGKPDPEGYARAARELGVDPADCVVFEDTAAGLRAGSQAGAATAVVGELDDEVTRGIPRLIDWSRVSVTVEDGWVVFGGL